MKILDNGLAIIERDTHFSRSIVERGCLIDEGTRNLFAPYVKPTDTIIDVGANIGAYTGIFCDLAPQGAVYALEPNQEAYQCLAINCPRAVCWPIGAGEFMETFEVDARGDNVGSAFLTPSRFGTAMCFPLDMLFPDFNPSLLKIDVEGMEYKVLMGAAKMISRCHPKIHIEYNRGTLARNGTTVEALRQYLFDLGYHEVWVSTDIKEPMADAILCHGAK